MVHFVYRWGALDDRRGKGDRGAYFAEQFFTFLFLTLTTSFKGKKRKTKRKENNYSLYKYFFAGT